LQNLGSAGENVNDPGLAQLIQVNLDAVNALYTDKLPEYFERLREARTLDGKVTLDSMPEDQQKTPPTGAGWVVELRGYTYHEDQRLFLVNTLFANLLDKAKENDISHLVLYRYHLDRSPLPQQYHLIRQTDLAQLVMGIKPDQLGTAVREAPLVSGQAAPKIDYGRAPWGPRGTVFGESKARTPAKDDEKAKPPANQINVRTEFVILFVWKERLGDDPAVAKTPAKKP
jgi:hypothetical protein